jgi:hypothetical protein
VASDLVTEGGNVHQSLIQDVVFVAVGGENRRRERLVGGYSSWCGLLGAHQVLQHLVLLSCLPKLAAPSFACNINGFKPGGFLGVGPFEDSRYGVVLEEVEMGM